ncbi:MAG: GyrI-like domain-containing protein [Dehalococcoidales bacterium]|nr:GyrI-like domain-containing protein [Dehalococcoidales bacterium]
MEPKIITKEAFLIAGVAGSGDETARVWQTYMKMEKMNPLKNQVGEVGYEVRMYASEGEAGKIHIGVQVKDSNVPEEYKLFFVPAATYAEFEIYPLKGYESSNAEMSKWLEDNASVYKEALLDGMKYGIEVYDKRFKGNDNPESVVGFLVPIVKIDPNFDITQMVSGPIDELAGRIKQFAGADVSKKVMQGKDEIIAAKDPAKGALWMKEALDRLDTLTDEQTRTQIMTACGRSCNTVNHKDTEEMKEMRRLCATEEDFIEKFIQTPGNGSRCERDGNILIQYYTPGKYKKGLRCYCSLINALPKGVNASPTYCQCSRSFVENHWSYVLNRPVTVELGETAITGADECKFIIHL